MVNKRQNEFNHVYNAEYYNKKLLYENIVERNKENDKKGI